MNEGIYVIEFFHQERSSKGVIVVDNHRLHGGNQAAVFRGMFDTHANHIDIPEIEVIYHNRDEEHVLDSSMPESLKFTGGGETGTGADGAIFFEVSGHVVGYTNRTMRIYGVKIADLISI